MTADTSTPLKTSWQELNPDELPEMMRHWYDIKKEHPDDIIAYRMGDFYEMFYDDAKKVSKLLGLTLTTRGSGPNRHPLAGIPHKATQHFKSLIMQGETVVIVEQLEDPKDAVGRIVKRGVIQVISPGTVIDDSLLEASKNNYLISISLSDKNYGVAFIDLSCGDFFCAECKGENSFQDLLSIIARFQPVECILPPVLNQNVEFITALKEASNLIIKQFSVYAFQYDNAYKTLLEHFEVKSMDGFGLSGMNAAICASGGILTFLNETQKTVLPNVTSIKKYLKEDFMYIDANTQRNLEILRNLQDSQETGSLLSILNKTSTPMGNRLMKKICVQPLLNADKIEERLDIVQLFKDDNLLRNDVRELLGEMGDMERIISRINYSRTANARDLANLKNALKVLPSIKHILGAIELNSLKKMIDSVNNYNEIIDLIEKAIIENPPLTVTEGGIIREGYDSRVDEMNSILKNGKDWILKFENEEKKRLNISTGLKIGFNRVLGYYIQITDNALKGINLPTEYNQRQTVKGATRYETEELQKMEVKILNADETVKDVEYELFCKVREKVSLFTKKIQNDAQIISLLDILCAFGETAAKNNYCRPTIKNHNKIIIKDGRHPVIEQINYSEPFIPNDTYIDTDNDVLLVITGPNWSGKSTYLRQAALITIMAQIGSFVPATSAEIGIVDKIFTRIGASDDLTRGQSTFMMEMNETAQILHYATPKSLVIIDELGRGTSTTDGKSIARAVMEFLHKQRIKTLFSTHYHELIDLPLERMKNYHFLIREEGKKLIFLRKLSEGGTDKSYGIHVALMAGVPKDVVDRAFELVETDYCIDNENESKIEFENEKGLGLNAQQHVSISPSSISQQSANLTKPKGEESDKIQKENNSSKKKGRKVQTLLFMPEKDPDHSEIIKELRNIPFDSLTPIEAMEILIKLRKKIKE